MKMKLNIFSRIATIILALIIVSTSLDVYAVDLAEKYRWSIWKGSASGFATAQSVANSGKKCEKDILCFNGYGMYIKLLKYDPATKTESLVGSPILVHTSSFISDARVIRTPADEAKINITRETHEKSGECEITVKNYFEFEEIDEYPGNTIAYQIDVNGSLVNISKSEIKFIQYEGLNFGNDGLGLSNAIKNAEEGIIAKYASKISDLKTNFNLSTDEYSEMLKNMDNYYLAFEPAVREPLKKGTEGKVQEEKTEVYAFQTKALDEWYCSAKTSLKIQYERGESPSNSYVGNINGVTVNPACSSYGGGCSKYTNSYNKLTYSSKADCDKICDGLSDGVSCSCTCSSWNETGVWVNNGCAVEAHKAYNYLETKIYTGTSVIKPAKHTNKTRAIKALVTLKDDSDCNGSEEDMKGNCVKSCVLDKENNCTGKYEYFIGPTLKTALVGSPDENGVFYNKYQLYSGNGDDINSSLAKTHAVGVSYWWLPGIVSCSNVCGSGESSSDSRLQCAENYCDNAIGYDDRANIHKIKYSCITDLCQYTYKPMSCTNSDKTVNTDVDIYSNESNYLSKKNIQSTCSIINTDEETKIKTEDSPNIITTCEVYDENKSIFDQKTYLVVACKESAAFQYADLSKTKIVAGEGLNYFANLHGGKECTVSFDIDSWKVAYASYHSEDLVCQGGSVDANGNCIGGTVVSPRKLLENMLNYYNKCSLGVTDEETKKLCDVGGDAIGINMDGTPVTTTWESLGYNTSKVEVKTQITEIIDNEKVKSDSYTLIQNKDKTDNSIVATSEKDAYSFAANKKISFGKVKTYLSTSNVEANYTFDKYCVTTDGKATIYKASADGKCKQDETTIESEDVFGKNVYFTSLNATPNSEITSNDKHAIEYTNVTVKNENDITYLTGQEYCPYKIEDIGLSCTIEIELMDSTTAHGNDIYDGKVKAKLRINNQLGTKDSIVGKGISTSERTTNGTEELEVSMLNPKNGAEIKDIYGIVTTKNGETVTCDKKIKLINPGNACSINKVEDNLYEIVTSYPGQTYYALTYDIKLHQEFTTYPKKAGFKAILKENGKNYVRVNEQSKSSRLYGAVIGSSGGYEVCWTDIMEYEDKEHPQCKTQCTNRTSAIEVQTFCNANWHEDIDNYSSYSDCVTNCKCELPSDLTCEIEKIKNYCETRYHECGFKDVSTCISYVYNELNCSGADYIYRPVNNSNPFPNSYESPIPGDRIIGGNWVGKTEYITDDSKDSTSVTGANAGNGQVEYEIHLTPSDIQEIRKNTEAYMSEGKNPYLDYIGVEQGKDGYCLEEGYCSEFINSSEFSTTIFKVK